jgi:hypothetical protein
VSRKIQLGRTGDLAIVDDADYDWLRKYDWHFHPYDATGYACRSTLGSDGRHHCIGMHRVIMKAPPDKPVDHINGDGLDNRRSNLRVCTDAGNAQNSKPRKHRRFKGVRHRTKNCYQVSIFANGTKFYLGSFRTEIEAARAYDQAARNHHREFARLNFPDDVKAVS